MQYQALLRHSQQIVRIVRDKANSATSFKLGNAYGTTPDKKNGEFTKNDVNSTELQIRTLSEMNLPSTSQRRPEAPVQAGLLPVRDGSTLYHSLNSGCKDYINAVGSSNAVRRSDGVPGTKIKTQLGKQSLAVRVQSQSKNVTATTHTLPSSHVPRHVQTNTTANKTQYIHQNAPSPKNVFNAFN